MVHQGRLLPLLLSLLILALSFTATWAAVSNSNGEIKISPDDGNPSVWYGFDVAASGTTYVVSAYGAVSDKGAIYVYWESTTGAKDWGTGGRERKITGSDLTSQAWFGNQVAIYGRHVLAGAWGMWEHAEESGALYVYTASGDTTYDWQNSETKLIPTTGYQNQHFGNALCIDGRYIAVGTPNYDSARGGFWLFQASCNTFTDWSGQVSFHNAGDASTGDYNAQRIDIHDKHIAFGSKGNDFYGFNAGAVYVFSESALNANDHDSIQTKVHPDGHNIKNGDFFATRVAIFEATIVVGAYGTDKNGYDSGVAYVMWESSTDARDWAANNKKIFSTQSVHNDYFGHCVDIWGSTISIGSYGVDSPVGGGAAYFFTESGLNARDWETGEVRIRSYDIDNNDRYGYAIATGDTGQWAGTGINVVVGAYADDDFGASSGSIYIEYVCPVGYEGANCATEIDECIGHACQNGGACQDQIGYYTCDCTATGYDGTFCDTTSNDCASGPCINGGVCSDCGISCFSCDCTGTGYSGTICAADADDCASAPCANSGVCSDAGSNAFNCDCSGTGYGSGTCADDIDDCASNPCLNGGTCSDPNQPVDTGTPNVYSCDCTGTGWESTECHVNIDECVSNPCQNGGVCSDAGVFAYFCDCAGTGWEDSVCSSDVDDCASGPCLNGGICTDTGTNSFSCDCTGTGWTSTTCNVDYDDCASNPCKNWGVCTDVGTHLFECDCDGTGFGGYWCCHHDCPGVDICDEEFKECELNECQQDGTNNTCIPSYPGSSNTCGCESGYDDFNSCGILDGCLGILDTCQLAHDSSALCVDALPPSTGHTCDCTPGFHDVEGVCVNFDGCEGDPCLAGGDVSATCDDLTPPSETYVCTCSGSGFWSPVHGGTCYPVDYCVDIPAGRDNQCAVAGDKLSVCTSAVFPAVGFTCSCSTGFEKLSGGEVCVDVDACASGDYCDFYGDTNAECYDLPAPSLTSTCMCTDGYEPAIYVDGGMVEHASCSAINDCILRDTCGLAIIKDFDYMALNETSNSTCIDQSAPSITHDCGCPIHHHNVSEFCVWDNVDGCLGHSNCSMHGDNDSLCIDVAHPNDVNLTYVCECSDGYIEMNGTCIEFDACTMQLNLCGTGSDSDSVCIDFPPPSWGYTCNCSTGYSLMANNTVTYDYTYNVTTWNETVYYNDTFFNATLNATVTELKSYIVTQTNTTVIPHLKSNTTTAGLMCLDIQSCPEEPVCASMGDTGATCVDYSPPLEGFECNCSSGYYQQNGTDYCVEIDACLLYRGNERCVIADKGASCIDDPPPSDYYTCNCTSGYGFTKGYCLDLDECQSNPCKYGGSCFDAGVNAFYCECTQFWTGETCEDFKDCLSNPCQNGGTCTDIALELYSCDCSDTGYEGQDCEVDLDDCLSSPCLNGGTCIDKGANAFVCNCPVADWGGEFCEIDANSACASSPCMNNATCINDNGLFTCECKSGWTNDTCGQDIDDCASNPCQHESLCTDLGPDAFNCTCREDDTLVDDWNGTLCEIPVNQVPVWVNQDPVVILENSLPATVDLFDYYWDDDYRQQELITVITMVKGNFPGSLSCDGGKNLRVGTTWSEDRFMGDTTCGMKFEYNPDKDFENDLDVILHFVIEDSAGQQTVGNVSLSIVAENDQPQFPKYIENQEWVYLSENRQMINLDIRDVDSPAVYCRFEWGDLSPGHRLLNADAEVYLPGSDNNIPIYSNVAPDFDGANNVTIIYDNILLVNLVNNEVVLEFMYDVMQTGIKKLDGTVTILVYDNLDDAIAGHRIEYYRAIKAAEEAANNATNSNVTSGYESSMPYVNSSSSFYTLSSSTGGYYGGVNGSSSIGSYQSSSSYFSSSSSSSSSVASSSSSSSPLSSFNGYYSSSYTGSYSSSYTAQAYDGNTGGDGYYSPSDPYGSSSSSSEEPPVVVVIEQVVEELNTFPLAEVTLQIFPMCVGDRIVPNVWSEGPLCEECPQGGVCMEENDYWPVNSKGYWLSPESDNFLFLPCHPANACPAHGVMTNETKPVCSTGYSGIVCGDCAPGYYRKAGNCAECEDQDYTFFIFLLLGLMLAMGAMMWLSSKGKFIFKMTGVVFTFVQTIAEFQDLGLEWTKDVKRLFEFFSVFSLNVELLSVECSLGDVQPAFQYRYKFVAMMLFPLGIAAGFFVAYLFLLVFRIIVPATISQEELERDQLMEEKGLSDDAKKSKLRLKGKKNENMMVRSFTMFLSFMYLPLIAQIMGFWDCTKQPDGRMALDANPGLTCYEDWWQNMIFWPMFGIFAYALGIPAYFIFALRKRPRLVNFEKEELKKEQGHKKSFFEIVFHGSNTFSIDRQDEYELALEHWGQRYSPLTLQYAKHAYYWQTMMISREALFSCVRVYATEYPIFQAGFIVVILFLYAMMQRDYLPFDTTPINRLELTTLICCIVVMLLGILLSGELGFSVETRQALGILVFTAIVLCSIYIFALMIRLIADHYSREAFEQELEKREGKKKGLNVDEEHLVEDLMNPKNRSKDMFLDLIDGFVDVVENIDPDEVPTATDSEEERQKELAKGRKSLATLENKRHLTPEERRKMNEKADALRKMQKKHKKARIASEKKKNGKQKKKKPKVRKGKNRKWDDSSSSYSDESSSYDSESESESESEEEKKAKKKTIKTKKVLTIHRTATLPGQTGKGKKLSTGKKNSGASRKTKVALAVAAKMAAASTKSKKASAGKSIVAPSKTYNLLKERFETKAKEKGDLLKSPDTRASLMVGKEVTEMSTDMLQTVAMGDDKTLDALIMKEIKEGLHDQELQQPMTDRATAALKEEQANMEADMIANACIVCMDDASSHCFVPCGHQCVCEKCAEMIVAAPESKCPMCRAKPTSFMRVFK